MPTYAIIETGGKQYRVSSGDVIDVERLRSADPGATLEIDKVVLLNQEGAVTLGTPYVSGARVTAKVVSEGKGKKIIVFKYKPKVRYRRKKGHRQLYSRIEIQDIHGAGKAGAEAPAGQRRKATKAKKTARVKGEGDGA